MLVGLVLFLLVVLGLSYLRVVVSVWLATFAVLVFWVGWHSWGWGLLCSAAWSGLALFCFCYPLRWHTVTKFVLHWFCRQLPPLSSMEKEALEAGGISWEKQFFSGRPNWQELVQKSRVSLTPEELAFIAGPVSTFCELLNDWDIQEQGDLPPAVWAFIKKERFWGLTIGKQYGGHGFSALAHSSIISKIASRSVAAAITVMVPNSVGPAEFITHYGTEEQKNYYLPLLARGDLVGCFALTALFAGSDAGNIMDSGIVCKREYAGKLQLGIRLSCEKRYITLASVADLMGMVFKLYDPDRLLGDQTDIGITVALVPTKTPGVEIGARHRCLDIAFLNGPIRCEDVFIPLECVVGGRAGCGKGWMMLMECLAMGRGISLPALSVGALQLVCRTTSAYSAIRQQFKRSIGEFEGVAEPLATICGLNYIAESARVLTAEAVDWGLRPAIAAAIVKYHLTEFSRLAVNHAMDIHAARSIQKGPKNYLSTFYEAAPISITVEGANILTRSLIIFGQGVLRCHPYLREELQVASLYGNAANNKRFDTLFWSHVHLVWTNCIRAGVDAVTGLLFVRIPLQTRVKRYLKQLSFLSNVLSLLSDFTLGFLGRSFKFRELLSSRLGDVLSYLYLASATFKRYHQAGESVQEWPVVKWALDYCLWNISVALQDFFDNFSHRWLVRSMRVLMFPFGMRYRKPSHYLILKIAQLIQSNTALREHLLEHCFVSNQSDDSVAALEAVFKMWPTVEPLWRKIQLTSNPEGLSVVKVIDEQIAQLYATGELSRESHQLLSKFAKQYLNVLEVDEFIK